jgi:hypothetical protein
VVLGNGQPLVYAHRGGRHLIVFEAGLTDRSWVGELTALVDQKRVRSFDIQKINGDPPGDHPDVVEALTTGGFKPGYKGPTYRR